MKSGTQESRWGMQSFSFWGVLVIALGIIFIGIRFIMQPETAALGYGIPFHNAYDAAYGSVKGIRDIFSGLVLLPLLRMRMRKALAWVFTAATLIPASDFLVVLFYNGSTDTMHLMIHGITAAVMAVVSFLLFYGIPETEKK